MAGKITVMDKMFANLKTHAAGIVFFTVMMLLPWITAGTLKVGSLSNTKPVAFWKVITFIVGGATDTVWNGVTIKDSWTWIKWWQKDTFITNIMWATLQMIGFLLSLWAWYKIIMLLFKEINPEEVTDD